MSSMLRSALSSVSGRDRSDAHHLRFDSGERVGHQAHRDRQAELLSYRLGRDEAGRGTVVETGRVASSHSTVRAERVRSPQDDGPRSRRFVRSRQTPAESELRVATGTSDS